MKQSVASNTTPAPAKGEHKPKSNPANLRSVFLGAVLSMSWQLAVVVLIPVVGGYKIDQHFNTSPAFTIVGFVIAILGCFYTIRRMLKSLDGVDNIGLDRK